MYLYLTSLQVIHPPADFDFDEAEWIFQLNQFHTLDALEHFVESNKKLYPDIAQDTFICQRRNDILLECEPSCSSPKVSFNYIDIQHLNPGDIIYHGFNMVYLIFRFQNAMIHLRLVPIY